MDTNENRVLDLYPLVSIRGKKSNNQKTQAIEFAEKFTRILCFLFFFVPSWISVCFDNPCGSDPEAEIQVHSKRQSQHD